jgi:hypothetical protein
MSSKPERDVLPPMWRTGDLVIIKMGDTGVEAPGIIIETSREWINHIGGEWCHTALCQGVLHKIIESFSKPTRIVRRVTDTSEDFWDKVRR